jgi:hypothetical protein
VVRICDGDASGKKEEEGGVASLELKAAAVVDKMVKGAVVYIGLRPRVWSGRCYLVGGTGAGGQHGDTVARGL